MEVIDLPPESLLERSRHVERFFYESMAQACHAVTALSEGEAVKGLPCGKATSPTAQPIGEGSTTVASKGSGQSGTATGIGSGRVHEYVPRYCTIRVLPSGEPQLLPGLSKKGGHVRGRPGSLPIEKVLAIWSGNKRLRQHRFRAPTNSGRLTEAYATEQQMPTSPLEQMLLQRDNELLVDLLTRCLKWLPDDRITPAELMRHRWFTNWSTPPKRSSHSASGELALEACPNLFGPEARATPTNGSSAKVIKDPADSGNPVKAKFYLSQKEECSENGDSMHLRSQQRQIKSHIQHPEPNHCYQQPQAQQQKQQKQSQQARPLGHPTGQQLHHSRTTANMPTGELVSTPRRMSMVIPVAVAHEQGLFHGLDDPLHSTELDEHLVNRTLDNGFADQSRRFGCGCGVNELNYESEARMPHFACRPQDSLSSRADLRDVERANSLHGMLENMNLHTKALPYQTSPSRRQASGGRSLVGPSNEEKSFFTSNEALQSGDTAGPLHQNFYPTSVKVCSGRQTQNFHDRKLCHFLGEGVAADNRALAEENKASAISIPSTAPPTTSSAAHPVTRSTVGTSGGVACCLWDHPFEGDNSVLAPSERGSKQNMVSTGSQPNPRYLVHNVLRRPRRLIPVPMMNRRTMGADSDLLHLLPQRVLHTNATSSINLPRSAVFATSTADSQTNTIGTVSVADTVLTMASKSIFTSSTQTLSSAKYLPASRDEGASECDNSVFLRAPIAKVLPRELMYSSGAAPGNGRLGSFAGGRAMPTLDLRPTDQEPSSAVQSTIAGSRCQPRPRPRPRPVSDFFFDTLRDRSRRKTTTDMAGGVDSGGECEGDDGGVLIAGGDNKKDNSHKDSELMLRPARHVLSRKEPVPEKGDELSVNPEPDHSAVAEGKKKYSQLIISPRVLTAAGSSAYPRHWEGQTPVGVRTNRNLPNAISCRPDRQSWNVCATQPHAPSLMSRDEESTSLLVDAKTEVAAIATTQRRRELVNEMILADVGPRVLVKTRSGKEILVRNCPYLSLESAPVVGRLGKTTEPATPLDGKSLSSADNTVCSVPSNATQPTSSTATTTSNANYLFLPSALTYGHQRCSVYSTEAHSTAALVTNFGPSVQTSISPQEGLVPVLGESCGPSVVRSGQDYETKSTPARDVNHDIPAERARVKFAMRPIAQVAGNSNGALPHHSPPAQPPPPLSPTPSPPPTSPLLPPAPLQQPRPTACPTNQPIHSGQAQSPLQPQPENQPVSHTTGLQRPLFHYPWHTVQPCSQQNQQRQQTTLVRQGQHLPVPMLVPMLVPVPPPRQHLHKANRSYCPSSAENGRWRGEIGPFDEAAARHGGHLMPFKSTELLVAKPTTSLRTTEAQQQMGKIPFHQVGKFHVHDRVSMPQQQQPVAQGPVTQRFWFQPAMLPGSLDASGSLEPSTSRSMLKPSGNSHDSATVKSNLGTGFVESNIDIHRSTGNREYVSGNKLALTRPGNPLQTKHNPSFITSKPRISQTAAPQLHRYSMFEPKNY